MKKPLPATGGPGILKTMNNLVQAANDAEPTPRRDRPTASPRRKKPVARSKKQAAKTR